MPCAALSDGSARGEAAESERRVLVEQLVEKVAVFPDHLEAAIAGAPRLDVGLAEVGLGGNQSQIVGVRGPTCQGVSGREPTLGRICFDLSQFPRRWPQIADSATRFRKLRPGPPWWS